MMRIFFVRSDAQLNKFFSEFILLKLITDNLANEPAFLARHSGNGSHSYPGPNTFEKLSKNHIFTHTNMQHIPTRSCNQLC